jgi:hypothetical protein
MVRTQDLCSDIRLNYHLFQKLKVIEKYKFNHLINILTVQLGMCTRCMTNFHNITKTYCDCEAEDHQ